MSHPMILRFPFEQLAQGTLDKDRLEPFRARSQVLLPHLLAFLGSTIKLVKDDTDKFSFKLTVQQLVEDLQNQKLLLEGEPVQQNWMRGVLKVLNHAPRGELLHSSMKQTKLEGVRYNASIPLILSAFKQFRNVQYEHWNWDCEQSLKAREFFLDRDSMLVAEQRGFDGLWTETELQDFRELTNTKQKPLTSVTAVVRIPDPKFKELPRLVKLMLLQLWAYHPSVRHPLAITNLQNFDEPAPPLVDSQISTAPNFQRVESQDEMWAV